MDVIALRLAKAYLCWKPLASKLVEVLQAKRNLSSKTSIETKFLNSQILDRLDCRIRSIRVIRGHKLFQLFLGEFRSQIKDYSNPLVASVAQRGMNKIAIGLSAPSY